MRNLVYVAHPVLWVLDLLVSMVLWLIGLPLIAALLTLGAYRLRPSGAYADRKVMAWRPRWAWIWGNDEDGVLGPRWWHIDKGHWSLWARGFVWSAWRNPVNNLRFVPPFGIWIDAERIRSRGNVLDSPLDDERRERVVRLRWSYTWQGVYAGFWLRAPLAGRVLNLRIGWKLIPRDRFGVPTNDYRLPGCGTGLQLQLRPNPYVDAP